jgi:hypothetical protein
LPWPPEREFPKVLQPGTKSFAQGTWDENFLCPGVFAPLEAPEALPISPIVSRAHPGAATSDIAQEEDD